MIDEIMRLMTPVEILESKEFPTPTKILPDKFSSFDDLILNRHLIRNLSLLPVKTNEMREYYNTLDKNVLAEVLMLPFQSCDIFGLENKFPYFLPPDTIQYIIWIKQREMSHRQIAQYIAKVIEEHGFDLDKVILFERPTNIDTTMVRGTFPAIRHIHLWTSK